jgi:hypothetical protein
MLKCIETCTERKKGRKRLNTIEGNANERKHRVLLGTIVKRRGINATVDLFKRHAAHSANQTRGY